MTILSDALSRAVTYDITTPIIANDRRIHRELTELVGDEDYPNAVVAAIAEIQSITAGDRTSGTMDLVFTLVEGTGFSVLALDWDQAASVVQTEVDAAALVANPTYVAGDFAVAGGAFGAAGSATTVTFGGPLGIGNQALITVVGTSLAGGTTDPVASETTAGVVPRFWFAALRALGVLIGTDPAFSATPAGQYTVNLRDSLENYPSNQLLRALIKEATVQEGEDWETELFPLLGLDRVADGVQL